MIETPEYRPENRVQKKQRATELDVLRGFAVLLMIGHHLMYDIHYIFGYPYFSWLFGPVMESTYHPLIYILFLGVAESLVSVIESGLPASTVISQFFAHGTSALMACIKAAKSFSDSAVGVPPPT